MTRTHLVVTGMTATALLVSGGVSAALVDTDDRPDRTVSARVVGKARAAGEMDCRATANSFDNNGYVYLYGSSYCKGAHDEKDETNDSDYGDGEGYIKDFDNKVDSIINKHKTKSVEFYNYPDYNKGEPGGDSFCVRPGHYVRRLYLYSDGSGTNNWWSNSISSHRFVEPESCDRWFGWLVP